MMRFKPTMHIILIGLMAGGCQIMPEVFSGAFARAASGRPSANAGPFSRSDSRARPFEEFEADSAWSRTACPGRNTGRGAAGHRGIRWRA